VIDKLHQVIQQVMPWEESHLHRFIIKMRGEREVTIATSEKKIALSQYLPDAKEVVYEYDFGDCWRHEIKLKKVISDENGVSYPRCVGGKMACPPEDCGGIYGYYEMLDIINGQDCEEKEEMLEWLGEDFDPNEFDIQEIKFSKRPLCVYAEK
jgi:hypothetical protein